MVLNWPWVLFWSLAGIWAVGLTIFVFAVHRSLTRITAGADKKRLDEILGDLRVELKSEQAARSVLERDLKAVRGALPGHLQKLGFERFNPFRSTGGNQSFTLAVLDGSNNGVILTSLHGREQTRLYAKPVRAGKTDSTLLAEEKQALSGAQEKT
jgi:hypothetical protein